MGDLAHLDDLFEHAQYHAEKYGDNFLVFISKHYGELQVEHSQDHREEQKEHEELPFINNCCAHVFTAYVILKIQLPLLRTNPVVDFTSNFYYLDNYSSFEKFDIFQPPRRA